MATISTTPPSQIQRQLATRTHGKRIALLLLLVFGGAIAGAIYLWRTKGKPLTEATVAAPTSRPWLKQAETYPDPEKPPVQPVDTISPELARLRNELLAMKLKIDELDKRKSGTTVVQPQQPAQIAAKPPGETARPDALLPQGYPRQDHARQYGPGVYAGALGDEAPVYHRAADEQ